MKALILICLCFLLQGNCTNSVHNTSERLTSPERGKMKGLSFVAPPDSFSTNPIPAVQKVNAEWIAVIPYGFTKVDEPAVRFNMSKWQWWGEREVGVRETIRLAHADGIKVMLKPQVYIPGSWPGGLSFNDSDWLKWEREYVEYIMTFVAIAEELDVELFCIGTEFKQSSTKRPSFWKSLIKTVKASYNGKLTYAANWDEYQNINFWDQLDYIGVDAYFPLVNKATPSVKEIKAAWQPIAKELAATYKQWDRPILFTEYGYLTVDRCAYNTWELEANVQERSINQQAQANAYEGLFQALWNSEFWAGGFVWKWFPNMQGHENYPERDYSPQGKLAQKVLADWYCK